MKRKTNLFYTKEPDSKFITFSNYTESLTGNFLSTDTKIFPSRFIVLYIKGLNKNTKPALIKYLADYYESKLAVLRDFFDYNKGDVEKSIPPLNYLLEALLRITSITKNGVEYDHSVSNQFSDVEDFNNVVTETDIVKFKYISDITEQDYNGTFTDTICNIDLRKFAYISSVELTSDFNDSVVQFDMPETLYGWDGDVPSEYEGEYSIPDSIQGINLDLYTTTVTEPDENQVDPGNQVDPDDLINSDIDDNSEDSNSEVDDNTEDNSSEVDDTDNIDNTDNIEDNNSENNIDDSTHSQEITNSETDNSSKTRKYVINDNLPNTVDLNKNDFVYTYEHTYIDDNEQEQTEITEISLNEYIDTVISYNGYELYTDAISYIMHSNDAISMSFKNSIDDILANNTTDNYVLFYKEDEDNKVYVYDGADVFELDMTKNNEYNVNPEITRLNINTSLENEMEFNCIIPLYDLVDINFKSNFNTIERIISVNGSGYIDLVPSVNNKMYCINVPLGMWFYTDGDTNNEETTSIKLYKDKESGFSQSWSLTIASQFKPFPYSSKMPSELTTNSNTNAYATFAQVLASQAAMIDNFNKLNNTIANMNDHIRNLESQLANLGTSYNIDNIHREFNNFEINMNNKFSVLKDEVINQLSYLKWKTTI